MIYVICFTGISRTTQFTIHTVIDNCVRCKIIFDKYFRDTLFDCVSKSILEK